MLRNALLSHRRHHHLPPLFLASCLGRFSIALPACFSSAIREMSSWELGMSNEISKTAEANERASSSPSHATSKKTTRRETAVPLSLFSPSHHFADDDDAVVFVVIAWKKSCPDSFVVVVVVIVGVFFSSNAKFSFGRSQTSSFYS